MKFSLIIPTYKRLNSLNEALISVIQNTVLPSEIIIIDDDSLESVFLEEWNKKCELVNIDFIYHKKNHTVHKQGLSESKNLALDLAREEIIFYIDDDVVLDEKYFEEIMNIWEKEKDNNKLFAVGGKITNNRKQSWFEKKIFNKVFGLKGKLAWDVNNVGFQVWDESVGEPQKSHYIHGGVSSYKKTLLKEFKFATFSGGRTGLEDVELAVRTKKAGYHFVYNPKATLMHYHEQLGREDKFLSGKKESQNRREIFRKHCSQSLKHRLWFLWANIGWIVKKIISGNILYTYGLLIRLVTKR